jgi:2-polyprenyl-6-methoxyphenol hydroxylase-like FAD-dependent oxidoreductase
MMTPTTRIETQCCIVGGGPAGVMLGVLLARAGVEVVVLEKHADFLRDFRGDTVHPSTMEVIHELGWLDAFLQRPHTKLRQVAIQFGDERVIISDFSHLRVRCPFIALMPQWEFLDFMTSRGRAYPTFALRLQSEVVDLFQDQYGVTGVIANTPQGPLEIRATLTVGADGRSSIVRERAGLEIETLSVPIDVLWMRLSRRPDDPHDLLSTVRDRDVLVTIDRGDYWQCAYVIPKGGLDALKQAGLDAFRQRLGRVVPILADRVQELRDWQDIKLLTVKIDRLRQWYKPGLLCIGDAAHAMSPMGGVGINLAIQDAVAAANRLAAPLRQRTLTLDDLRKVQRRRSWPTRVVQAAQVFGQDRVINQVLTHGVPASLPLPLRLWKRLPFLWRLPARGVGIGLRPEHIRTVPMFSDLSEPTPPR